MKQFIEGKESLFSQSQYIQFANDLRKYHLKKEIESTKNNALTVDKLTDINEMYKPRDFQLSTSIKPQEVNKMIAKIMSRPFHSSSTTRYSREFKSTMGRDKFLQSEDRLSLQGPINANDIKNVSFDHIQ